MTLLPLLTVCKKIRPTVQTALLQDIPFSNPKNLASLTAYLKAEPDARHCVKRLSIVTQDQTWNEEYNRKNYTSMKFLLGCIRLCTNLRHLTLDFSFMPLFIDFDTNEVITIKLKTLTIIKCLPGELFQILGSVFMSGENLKRIKMEKGEKKEKRKERISFYRWTSIAPSDCNHRHWTATWNGPRTGQRHNRSAIFFQVYVSKRAKNLIPLVKITGGYGATRTWKRFSNAPKLWRLFT